MLIHGGGFSSYLFKSSLISLNNILYFSVYMFYTTLSKFSPKYFVLLCAVFKFLKVILDFILCKKFMSHCYSINWPVSSIRFLSLFLPHPLISLSPQTPTSGSYQYLWAWFGGFFLRLFLLFWFLGFTCKRVYAIFVFPCQTCLT